MKRLLASFGLLLAVCLAPAQAQFNGCGPGFCQGISNSSAQSSLYFVGTLPTVTNLAANWASCSGCAGGAGVPSSTTNVIFDSNSGSGTLTNNLEPLKAASVTFGDSSLTFVDNEGMLVTGAVTFNSGTLNTNGQTESWGSFISTGATARTLTLTNSTIYLTSPALVVLNTNGATNLTSTLTGSAMYVTGIGSTFQPGSLVFPNVTFNGGGDVTASSGTYGNLTFIGNNSQLFDNAATIGNITVSGAFTVTGFSQGNRILVNPSNAIRTLTLNGTASVSNAEFRSTTVAGSLGTLTGTNIGDDGGNTNITFTAAVTLHWINNSGNWSDPTHYSLTSGGATANLVPQPQDTVDFDSGSFTLTGQTVTLNYAEYAAMNWTGVTNAPNMLLAEGGNLCGNMTLAAGMTTSAPSPALFNTMSWYKYGAAGTITTNGVGFAAGLGVISPGGSLTLGSNFTQSASGRPTDASLTVQLGGTFNDGGFNVSLINQVLGTGTTSARGITKTGNWTLTTNNATPWSIGGTGFTLSDTAGSIKLQGSAPTGTRTFAGGGLSYHGLEWAAEGVTSTLAITGNNTFGTLQVDPDVVGRTFTLPASGTQTITTYSPNGASGALLTINSSTAGTQSTVSQASGTVAATYLALKDSKATGGATFTATTSIDNGNNTGWTITP